MVSVLVLAYNHANYIESCLLSLVSQDYRGDYEIIVSDDCSQDGTYDVILSFVSHYPDYKFVLNRNQRNMGIGFNLKKLWSLASGDIYIMCDGDDVSANNRISTIVKYYQNNPNVYLIDSQVEFLVGCKLCSNRHLDSCTRRYDIKDYINKNPIRTWGCTRTYRREIISMFGEFRDTTPTGDTPTVLRGLLLGEIIVVPDILVSYRIHENQISNGTNIKSINRVLISYQYFDDVIYAVRKKYVSVCDFCSLLYRIMYYYMAAKWNRMCSLKK